MAIVTIHAAKTHLSNLIERARDGESVIIARGPMPVARLIPFHRKAVGRRFGVMAGMARVDERFFTPPEPGDLADWGA